MGRFYINKFKVLELMKTNKTPVRFMYEFGRSFFLLWETLQYMYNTRGIILYNIILRLIIISNSKERNYERIGKV